MQEWEEKVIERQEAFEAGKAAGREDGEKKMEKLVECLLQTGRMDDMEKALSDKDYRKKLYNEFGI